MVYELTRTFKLTIAYDGSDFAGWQVQPNQPTIQGCLQDAIKTLTGEDVSVIGSGRTDAGVHALAQVASCRLDSWNASADALARAINTKLPETIVVNESVQQADGFHAIASAVSKRYRYQIQVGGLRDPFAYRYCWHLKGDVDVQAMQSGARRFEGEHDFASFEATGAPRRSTVRNVKFCGFLPVGNTEVVLSNASFLALEIEANGFLYNMVRNIVGTLVEIGRGKHAPEWIDELIAAKDRDLAGPTAPPQGLLLKQVTYPESLVFTKS